MTVTLPRYKYEISFTSSPFTGLSFTDVTNDVRLYANVHRERGRSDAFSQIQTGQFAFTVDNTSGDYTPEKTTGSHYPNVDLVRAVRITSTEDGITYYPYYYGYIDDMTLAWDNTTGLMSNVLIHCVDITSALGQHKLTDDDIVALYMTVLPTVGPPADWFRFDDPAGTTSPANIGTGGTTKLTIVNETLAATVTFGADGLPLAGRTAVAISGSSLAPPNPGTQYDWVTTGWGFGVFWKWTGGKNTFDVIGIGDASFTNYAIITIGPDGVAVLNIAGWISTFFSDFDNKDLRDGQWHYLAAKFDPNVSGGTFILVVDTSTTAISGFGPGAGTTPVSLVTENLTDIGCVVADAAFWNQPILSGDLVAIYQAGVTGFSGETSAARISRILSFYNPPLTLATIGTMGARQMAPWRDLAGKTFLELINVAVDVEQGWFYADPAGVLTLRSRLARYNQTVALTLGSDNYEETLAFLKDRTNFVNDEAVTPYAGNVQEVLDSTSQNFYGAFGDTKTLDTLDPNEALAYAQNRVGTGKPKSRSPKVDVDLLTQQATTPGLLAAFWQLDLGELVALSAIPSQAAASAANFLVEGIVDDLTHASYAATINTSAAPATGAWKLQDAVLGLLGSTTYLAY